MSAIETRRVGCPVCGSPATITENVVYGYGSIDPIKRMVRPDGYKCRNGCQPDRDQLARLTAI